MLLRALVGDNQDLGARRSCFLRLLVHGNGREQKQVYSFKRYPNRYLGRDAKLCFCKNNKRMIIIIKPIMSALEARAESADVQDAETAGGSGEGEEGKEGESMREESLQECLRRCEEVLGQLQLQHNYLSPACKTKLMMSFAASPEEDEAQQLMHLRCPSAVGDAPRFFSPELQYCGKKGPPHEIGGDKTIMQAWIDAAPEASISVKESAALAADCLHVPSTVGLMLVGVRVERLLPLGPAFEANLEPGDTILAVDDRLVSAVDVLEGLTGGTPHQLVRLKVQKACGSTVISTLTRMPILRGQVAEIKDTFDKLTQTKVAVTRAEREREREREDRKIRNSSLSEVMSAIDEAFDSWFKGVLRQHARSLQRNGVVNEAIARLQESLITLTKLFNSDLTAARAKQAATARVAHTAKAEAAAVSVALKDSDQKIEALQMAAAEMSKEMMKVKKEKEEMKEEMMKMRKEEGDKVVMLKAELASAHSVIKTQEANVKDLTKEHQTSLSHASAALMEAAKKEQEQDWSINILRGAVENFSALVSQTSAVVLDLQQERAHLQEHLECLSTRIKEEQAEVEALRESFAQESQAIASTRERERTVQVKAVGLLQDQSAASIAALRARLQRHEQAELALKRERDTQAAELHNMQADHALEMEELISINEETLSKELAQLYSWNPRAAVQRVRDSGKSGPVIGSEVELLPAGSSGGKSPLLPRSEISMILGFWGFGPGSASAGAQERTKRLMCLSCGEELEQAITESGFHYCDNCQPADAAWKQEEWLPTAIQPSPIGGEDPPSSSVPSYISPRKPSRAFTVVPVASPLMTRFKSSAESLTRVPFADDYTVMILTSESIIIIACVHTGTPQQYTGVKSTDCTTKQYVITPG